MRQLLGMVLMLVLVGSEAQNLVNVSASLGQDVTLNCSYNYGDIHWFMKVQNQFRIRIGQIFSQTASSYDSPDFETKFLMTINQLVIQNFSTEDSRRFFCGRKKNDTSGRTFILIPEPSVSSTVSQSYPTETIPVILQQKAPDPVLLTSLSLNVFLLAAVLCFTAACIRRNGCCRVEESAEYSVEEMQNPQYEEIQLPPAPVSSECIYSKAWHPGSMPPHY